MTNVTDCRQRETQISKQGNTNMATKTAAKTNRNAKAASKATTNKATKKNATVAKPAAKESKLTNKMSQIEAAVAVLAKAKEPMNCKTMVDAMQGEGLWTSPGGATPDTTLYASILREINTKTKDARFRKVDRGLFALTGKK